MDKLTKEFQPGEVLKAQDLNVIKDKVNELVDTSNSVDVSSIRDDLKSLKSTVDSILSAFIIAEDINTEFSLASVSINEGASTTSEQQVNIKFVYSGTPTHHMISESPSFVGASWIAFTNPALFTLSSGNGTKTVYAKIKGTTSESAVKSDSINYSPITEVSLNSISINDEAETTSALQVSVKFACNGSPTHYMLSESQTFEGASWTAYTNSATFNLSGGEGTKTIYGKVKNSNNESSVVSDSINYSTTVPLSLTSISINNDASSTNQQQVSVKFTFAGTPTHYMLSENSTFAGASWMPFANPAAFGLSSGNGTKTVYAKIKDASGESAVKNDSIAFSTVVGGNIEFTDPEFKRIMVGKFDTNSDGEVSVSEAEVVKVWGSEFFNNTILANANELKYFKNTSPNFNGSFAGCTALKSIEYPDNWIVGSNELKGDISLTHVKLPGSLIAVPNSTLPE